MPYHCAKFIPSPTPLSLPRLSTAIDMAETKEDFSVLTGNVKKDVADVHDSPQLASSETPLTSKSHVPRSVQYNIATTSKVFSDSRASGENSGSSIKLFSDGTFVLEEGGSWE